eukprot:COSAG01_NODE_3895_length_5574_cov_17.445297_2_plen_79_part_00
MNSNLGLDVRAVAGAILHAIGLRVAAVAVAVVALLALASILELAVVHLVGGDMVKLIGGLVNGELDHPVYHSLENSCA